MKPSFQGEVQFAAWTDSGKSGPRVTFRLQDREELEPFVGKEGRRYMAVLVEIGDDENPVEPIERPKPKQTPSGWCAMRGKEPQFQQWLLQAFPSIWAAGGSNPEHAARHVICAVCGVERRAVFDTDKAALSRLKDRIINPWRARCEAVGADVEHAAA